MAYSITTQKDLRAAFWEAHPRCAAVRRPGGQNAQGTDVRMTWCDYVEAMNRNGEISDALADRATL
jgi:hypothetical protein